MQIQKFITKVAVTAGVLASAAAAQAGVYGEITRGLYLAGFQTSTSQNPLTHGWDATSSKLFADDTLNYGISSLTLNGGLTFQGSVYKKPFTGASFGVTTSASPKIASSPLQYTLTIPRAAEQITVSGTIDISTKTKVDSTGYYSTSLNIVNTGTATFSGATDKTVPIDFNVGPINQVGNVYLKGIGAVVNLVGGPGDKIAGLPDTGPLFSLASADSLTKMDTATLDSLNLDDPAQLQTYVNAVLLKGITQAATDPTVGKSVPSMATVPEPATLTLLALSGSLTLLGVRRRPAH